MTTSLYCTDLCFTIHNRFIEIILETVSCPTAFVSVRRYTMDDEGRRYIMGDLKRHCRNLMPAYGHANDSGIKPSALFVSLFNVVCPTTNSTAVSNVCMYGHHIYSSKRRINRVRLPILFVVSCGLPDNKQYSSE